MNDYARFHGFRFCYFSPLAIFASMVTSFLVDYHNNNKTMNQICFFTPERHLIIVVNSFVSVAIPSICIFHDVVVLYFSAFESLTKR
jgi:hypothetical protein